MGEILRNPRQGCDLHGALQTLEALKGAAAIVHANAGCVYQHYLSDKAGCLAEGSVFGPAVPSTEVIEKQIVFGGASRLREEIKNAAKVIDASLYVVLGSCEAAMVGDDLASITREALDSGIPALCYFSAGFRGGGHWGYANLMKTLFLNLKAPGGGRTKGLVNILGIIPKTDLFYKGDLAEIKRLLEAAGLRATTYFGPQDGIAELERSGEAEHTLVFSHWGLEGAKQLRERFGIPYTVFESLPLGLEGVKDFYRRLGSVMEIDGEKTAAFLGAEEKQYYYYLDSLSDPWHSGDMGKSLVLAGDTSAIVRLASFLRRDAGAYIHTAVITDAYANGKGEEKPPPPKGAGEYLFFCHDAAGIGRIIAQSEAEMVLGSALERDAAEALNIPHLTVSAPGGNQIPLHKTYAGIRGAYFLLEDYSQAVLGHNEARRKEHIRYLEKAGGE